MVSKREIEARRILDRLEKTSQTLNDGLTPNAPTSIIDTYRAQQTSHVKSKEERFYLDNLELSRRIMEIDSEFYGVSEVDAHKLLDYMEQEDFDVVPELTLELQQKKKVYNEMVNDTLDRDLEEFLSADDYRRALIHGLKETKRFARTLRYLELVIKTIKNYELELLELAEEEQYPDFSATKPDFSFNFTNQNNDTTSNSKVR
jgi:hypothetical protein